MTGIEFLRGFHHGLQIEIADIARLQNRHALPAQADLLAGLGSLGNGHDLFLAGQSRHADFTAQSGCHHRNRHAAIQIRSVALEEIMRFQRDENIEIAGRAAAQPAFSLTGQPDTGAVIDTGRHIDRQSAFACGAARARTGRAGIFDHLAAPLAMGAGPLHRKKALCGSDTAVSAAGGTGFGLGACFGAGPRTGFTADRDRNGQCGCFTVEGIFQRDFEIVAQIGAALAAIAAARAASAHIAEQVFENIRHAGGKIAGKTTGAATAIFKGRMAEAIIGCAFLPVRERLIRLVELFETGFGLGIIGIAVGMIFHRQFAEGRFQLGFIGRPCDVKNFIIIAFAHDSAIQSARGRNMQGSDS